MMANNNVKEQYLYNNEGIHSKSVPRKPATKLLNFLSSESKSPEEMFDWLKKIIELLPFPIIVIDASNYRIKLSNMIASKNADGEIPTCHVLTHRSELPCDSEEHPCPLKIIKETKTPAKVEHIHFDKFGDARNVEVNAIPVFNQNGEIKEIIEYCIDITDNKKFELDFMESERRFRALFEQSNDAIFIYDLKGKILDVNSQAAKMLGYEIDTLIQMTLPHLQAENCDNDTFTNITEYIKKDRANFEARLKKSDGSILDVYIGSRIIDKRNSIILGIVRDITEEKPNQKRLHLRTRKLEKRLKEIDCLYSISTFLSKDGISEKEKLDEIVNMIPSAFQYPTIACARINIIGQEYVSDNFQETEWTIGKEFKIADQIIGRLQVYYREKRSQSYRGPFQKEEYDFICAVANHVTNYFEHEITQSELKRQTEILSNIISNIPYFVFWKDRDSVFLGSNDNFAHVAGLKNSMEIVGKTDYDLAWKKEESDSYIKCDQEIMASGEAKTNIIESQLQVDGSESIISTSRVPLKDPEGNVIGLLGIYNDITDQRKSEEKLERAMSLMRATLEATHDGILVTDSEGNIIDYNQRFLELWNISNSMVSFENENAILESLFNSSIDPEYLQNLLDRTEVDPDLISHGQVELKNGKVFEFSSHPQVKEGGGSSGWVWSFHDITNARKAEEKLSQIVNQYTALIDTVPAVMFIKDENSRYTVVNERFCKRINSNREQIIGKTDKEIFPAKIANASLKADQEIMSGKRLILNEEKTVESKKGTEWIAITKVPLQDDNGKSIGIVGMIQDITEKHKDRERLMQSDKMAAVGTLAAGVAHEINNPMGFISSNLNTMKKYLARVQKFMENTNLTENEDYGDIKGIMDDFGDAIDESLDGTVRVKNIVADLKSFSRVDRAKAEKADLNAGIKSTLNIVWNQLKYHCRVETDYGDLPEIYCIPNQINQVFMNILINAGQAITHKSGLINVKTWADEANIYVSIKDNGCGIDRAHRQKLFEAFFTTKEVGKGTGLGLSMAYDIIKKHRGNIEVNSEVGKGSEFIITLPLEGMNE